MVRLAESAARSFVPTALEIARESLPVTALRFARLSQADSGKKLSAY